METVGTGSLKREFAIIRENVKELILRIRGEDCFYCGEKLDKHDNAIDHIIPLEKGGDNKLNNLVLCCWACKSEKQGKTLDEFVPDNLGLYVISKSKANKLLKWVQRDGTAHIKSGG